MVTTPLDYTVAEVIARGATAETLAVRSGERELVVKRLLPHAAHHPEARAAFAREARILARLAGRGAPRLVHADTDADAPLFVTERAPGVSLDRLGEALVARFEATSAQAFAALARVHEASDDAGRLEVVHGDVSPANVLVSDAMVTLVDFELGSDRDGRPPGDGAFRGTLASVAPEVARGERVTTRSDLFSLAASLATTLAIARGGPPLRDSSRAPAAAWVLAAEVPLVVDEALLCAHASPPFARALLACLAHDPSARPPAARDVAALAARQR